MGASPGRPEAHFTISRLPIPQPDEDREKSTFERLEDTLKISGAQWRILDLTAGWCF